MKRNLLISLLLAAALNVGAGPSAAAPRAPRGAELAAGGQGVSVFHSKAELVNMVFSVQGHGGKYLHDLQRENFKVLEDDRSQAIQYFSVDEDEPLTIGMAVDASNSETDGLSEERALGKQFLHAVLRQPMPKTLVRSRVILNPPQADQPTPASAASFAPPPEHDDQAFIVSFDKYIHFQDDTTTSPPRLDAALDKVALPTDPKDGGTALWDAIYQACVTRMQTQSGRKALIVLSDGDENSSHARYADALTAAEDSNTVVYFIDDTDPNDPNWSRPSGPADKMRDFAEATGGRTLVSYNHTLGAAFQAISDELRSQYTLGYRSDHPQHDGRFRQVKIELVAPPPAAKGAKISVRAGYTLH